MLVVKEEVSVFSHLLLSEKKKLEQRVTHTGGTRRELGGANIFSLVLLKIEEMPAPCTFG